MHKTLTQGKLKSSISQLKYGSFQISKIKGYETGKSLDSSTRQATNVSFVATTTPPSSAWNPFGVLPEQTPPLESTKSTIRYQPLHFARHPSVCPLRFIILIWLHSYDSGLFLLPSPPTMNHSSKSTNQSPSHNEAVPVMIPYSCTTFGYVVVHAPRRLSQSDLWEFANEKYEQGDYVEEFEEPKPEWLLEEANWDVDIEELTS